MKTQHGRELTPQEMAEMLDEWCNGASKKDIEACTTHLVNNTHRTIQQRIMGFVVGLLEKFSTSGYDARNAATVTLAAKLLSNTDKYDRMLPFI